MSGKKVGIANGLCRVRTQTRFGTTFGAFLPPFISCASLCGSTHQERARNVPIVESAHEW